MKPRLIEEKHDHYVMHDGAAPFRVPKFGLSEQMHTRIRGMAGGGEVRAAVAKTVTGGGQPARLTDVMHSRAPQELPDERVARKKAERAEESGEGFADGGAVNDPRWLNYADPEAMQSVEPPAVSVAPVAPSLPALPQDRYPPPAGGASMPLTPMEAEVSSRMASPANAEQVDAEKALAARQAREGAGIKPGAAPASTQPRPAGAQPAPIGTRPGGGGGPNAAGEMGDAVKAEQQALLQRGDAEAQQGRQTASALADVRSQIQQNAIEQKEQQTRARSAASEMMGQYKQQLDEMRKVDATVDQGRFWASRTTGQKVLGIIGLALGAVGAGRDGVNRAAGMMSQAIDRDIEAQKAETEAKLRKGGAALAGAQQMYALNRQLFQDDIAATAASKATALELADNQLKQIAATASSPIAKANAAAMSAQLQQAKAKFDADLQQRAAELGIKRQALDIEAAKVGAAAAKAGAGKNAGMATGALQQAQELEQALLSGKVTNVDQMEASLELEMLKAQGGRQGPEMMALNRRLTDSGILERISALLAPGRTKERFQNIAKHIRTTTGTSPAPEEGD